MKHQLLGRAGDASNVIVHKSVQKNINTKGDAACLAFPPNYEGTRGEDEAANETETSGHSRVLISCTGRWTVSVHTPATGL